MLDTQFTNVWSNLSLRLILQLLKMSSQAIMLLGIFVTMFSYLVITDWQTIPYDPCTEFSPFHHPDIAWHSKSDISWSIQNSFFPKASLQRSNPTIPLHQEKPLASFSLKLLPELNLDQSTGHIHRYQADFGLTFSCKKAESCDCEQLPSKCLIFPTDNKKTMKFDHSMTTDNKKLLQCTSSFNSEHPITFCIVLYLKNSDQPPTTPAVYESFLEATTAVLNAEIDSINILPDKQDKTNCVQANVSGHQCHWIPYSDIFKKECEDCQPICRSVHQTLTFPQFIIGNGVLLLAGALQYVSINAILVNQSPTQTQVHILHNLI